MKKIGIPIDEGKSNLKSDVSAHFGRAPFFMIISYDEINNKIIQIENVFNVEKPKEGCVSTAMKLIKSGINYMILNGIGYKPLLTLKNNKVELLTALNKNIKENFEAFRKNELKELNERNFMH